jgi:uncharacterized protein
MGLMGNTGLVRLDPARYKEVPWKNGGGTSITIAQQHRDGATAEDWSSLLWQFGRTPIVASAPFSHLAGLDRLQVLVAGSGLVLETPQGEIDVRQPFRPVRFTGETPVVCRLENGPVEVVNLMAARADASIDLRVLQAGETRPLGSGVHILYAPVSETECRLDGKRVALAQHHAIRINGAMTLEQTDGILLVATVVIVS